MITSNNVFLLPSQLVLTVGLIIVLASCGGGGGGGDTSTPTSNAVTLTYPSGRIMAVGEYEPGTTTKTGAWKEYFDQEGSPQQWQRSYSAGTWDRSKDWREWNSDASIRNDASDH
jgi:hypothetical protein